MADIIARLILDFAKVRKFFLTYNHFTLFFYFVVHMTANRLFLTNFAMWKTFINMHGDTASPEEAA